MLYKKQQLRNNRIWVYIIKMLYLYLEIIFIFLVGEIFIVDNLEMKYFKYFRKACRNCLG